MGTQGSFGYKIGDNIYLMHVQFDADLLWQILVREIYVLMKHYSSIELLREVFVNLLEAKNQPSPKAIEKCKVFTNLKVLSENTNNWYYLTQYCQHSFINILESGYFLNNGENLGLVFILDFNTNSAHFYSANYENKITELEKATIDEILEFKEMPTKTYTEIVAEMRERFEKYYENVKKINLEVEQINNIIKKAREFGGDENVISKAKKLLDNMELVKQEINMNYRFFYHRLDILNLIDHEEK